MAVSSAGLRPKSDCSGKAQKQLYSNLQTCNCLKEISRRTKNWSQVPDERLTPGQTGRLTVGRKLIATGTRLPLWSSDQSSWLQIQRSQLLFPALPDFLRNNGSGTGLLILVSIVEEVLGRNNSSFSLEIRERSHRDPSH
jgi:hypothetical protein